ARTTYGHIGVKVWLYRGDILPEAPTPETRPERPAAPVDKPRKGWRRVGVVRKVEPEPDAQPVAAAEGEETAAVPEQPETAPESPPEPEAIQAVHPESAADSEEHSNHADAVQGQAPETTQGPQTG
ncbi:MAG: hypothetical protein JSV79_06250, partial [Armatimonadota bacterium]